MLGMSVQALQFLQTTAAVLLLSLGLSGQASALLALSTIPIAMPNTETNTVPISSDLPAVKPIKNTPAPVTETKQATPVGGIDIGNTNNVLSIQYGSDGNPLPLQFQPV